MVQRFDNRVAQITGAALGALIALLGLAGVAESLPGTAAVYLLFGGYTVVRGLRSSCVVVDGSTVSTRSMVPTRVEHEVLTPQTDETGAAARRRLPGATEPQGDSPREEITAATDARSTEDVSDRERGDHR